MELKFGKEGLNNETPKSVKTTYRLIMLLSTLWVMTIQPNCHFSEHVQSVVNQWLVVGNGAFYTICQFFGWAKTDTDNGTTTV